jgi:phospholipid transport system substrate-binding protein
MGGRQLERTVAAVPRGIPVGPAASRLIAEITISDVDQILLSEGIEFVRYSDDFRLFASTEADAYRKLTIIARALIENHGLTLQQHKTKILPIERFRAIYLRENEKKEVETLSERFYELLKQLAVKSGGRAKLVSVIEERVLPHFNFTAMTALAMGQNWAKANPEQKKRLTEEFRTLLVRTYASALAAYSEQKFDFRPLRAKSTDTDVTVNVRVLQPGAQPVTIDYSMEKTANGWKVYDVMVGGVSLVANYRTEFSNIVRNSGIDGLIKDLQAKNRSLDKR